MSAPRLHRASIVTWRLALAWVALVASLTAVGCRPSQCGARNEPCCGDECLDPMLCLAGSCRAPCPQATMCDVVTGQGCGPGETCRVAVSGDAIVATCTATPPGGAGAEADCTRSDDCAAGLYCYRGRCRFTCCDQPMIDDTDCANALQYCVPLGGVGVCDGDDHCDIFTQTGCFGDFACVPQPLRDGSYTPTCLPAGTTPTGGACTRQDECVGGHRCVESSAFPDGACSRLCDATHPCPAGACLELTGNPGYGFCSP
ncbi:MAG: hypothetical protein U0353_17055 [Sandaracinus sp.]